MFLKKRDTGKLVEVLGMPDLFNPNHPALVGRFHAGEEVQDPEKFEKADLVFCSGEEPAQVLDRRPLPRRRGAPLLSVAPVKEEVTQGIGRRAEGRAVEAF